MKLTITPTESFFMADDVMVRMWKGATEDGRQCIVMVTAVAFEQDLGALTEGLISIPPPSPEDAERWARKVLEQGSKS